MNHPHSDQSVHQVCRRRLASGPHNHLVNASVSPLDHHSSARSPAHRNDGPGSHPVVDGALITSTVVIPDVNKTVRPVTPAPMNPVNPPVPVVEPERSMLRRVVDDPYWALVTLMAALGVSITATVVYGVTQITLLVTQWLRVNGGTVATVIVIVLLAVCVGGTTARCAGIHCGGCKR